MHCRSRVLEVEAAPLDSAVSFVIGDKLVSLARESFDLLFERVAVAAESPPAMADAAVVVIAPVLPLAPVPALPTSAQWSSAAPPAPRPTDPRPRLAPGKGQSAIYGGPWVCPTCTQVAAGGRKCGHCGATNPKILEARPAPRKYRPVAAREA